MRRKESKMNSPEISKVTLDAVQRGLDTVKIFATDNELAEEFADVIVSALVNGYDEHKDSWLVIDNLKNASEECIDAFNYLCFHVYRNAKNGGLDVKHRVLFASACRSLFDAWKSLKVLEELRNG